LQYFVESRIFYKFNSIVMIFFKKINNTQIAWIFMEA
jgi:hypothetical protein